MSVQQQEMGASFQAFNHAVGRGGQTAYIIVSVGQGHAWIIGYANRSKKQKTSWVKVLRTGTEDRGKKASSKMLNKKGNFLNSAFSLESQLSKL